MLNYTSYIGLSFLDRRILLSFIQKLDCINEEKLGYKLFADNVSVKEPIEKQKLVQNLIETLPMNRNNRTEHEKELYAEYSTLSSKIKELKREK